MAFVLDASVTMGWCFADEADHVTDAALDRLRTERAIVPGLWALEVVNVLLVAERRGRIEPAGSARFLELLRGLPIEEDWDLPLDQAAALFDVARRYRLSAYDATYVVLAARRGLGLATKDVRLAEAARGEGVALLHSPF